MGIYCVAIDLAEDVRCAVILSFDQVASPEESCL